MSRQDTIQRPLPLKGEGMDESNPTMLNGTFFRTNGLFSQFGDLERFNGKNLSQVFGEPIVAIHSAQMVPPAFWVQTPTTLYLLDEL